MKSKYLDLKENTVLGWEADKNIILVDAIKEGIRAGDEFKPINLVLSGKNEYFFFPYMI